MNADLRERLEALAADRARRAGPDAGAALLLGARRYRWHVWRLYAVVLIVTAMLGGGLAAVGPVGAGEAGGRAVVDILPGEETPSESTGGEETPGEDRSGADDGGEETADEETPREADDGETSGEEAAGEVAGGAETPDEVGGGDSRPPVLTALTLSPAAPVLVPGGQHRFTVEGTYSDGTVGPVSGTVSWDSVRAVDDTGEAPVVATVDGTGLVTAVSPGEATVTAVAGDVVGTAPVAVAAPPPVLTAITVAPATPEPPAPPAPVVLESGQQQRFTAQGLYSDGTVGPVTEPLVWDVTDQAPPGGDVDVVAGPVPIVVATVDGTGLVTARTPGTASVIATAGDVVGAAPVVVTPPVQDPIE